MSKIFIEARPALLTANVKYHLYLVYQDDEGSEFVIRGGTQVKDSSISYQYGDIAAETGVPMEDSMDYRDPDYAQYRGQVEIDLQGRNADDVWSIMVQQAQNINDAGLSYSSFLQNSNSVITSVLKVVGIDVINNLPANTEVSDYPAIYNSLSIDTNLSGTYKSDVIHGMGGNDIISGGIGNDSLFGGDGQDIIYGGYGHDYIQGGDGADILSGGVGFDVFDFNSLNDSVIGAQDYIADFTVGVDKIDISDTEIASIEDLSVINFNRNTFIIHEDSNFAISLEGEISLTESDFIF